jgi:hypothetical protein
MVRNMTSRLLTVAFALTFAAGCGGASGNQDLEVNDTGSTGAALQGPSDDTTGNSGSDVGDKDCKDGDHDGHARHHRHKFSVLDAMDGVKDGQITIANLPPGLPQRLIDKLHQIDTDGDGIVTKAEVKAFRKAHHHEHGGDHDGDHDEQGEQH